MNSNSINKTIENSLSSTWNNLLPLSKQEGQELFQLFVSQCVKEEFYNKFLKSFNSSKKIGSRYFSKYTNASKYDDIKTVLSMRESSKIEIKVLWGGFDNPIAFRFSGNCSHGLDKIFIIEDDSIVMLKENKKTHFLFMDGHTGQIYYF
ncbi:MAG: hypothetical protein H8D23_30195 [Candidatus Brocadiales bacterium]|nr:hypothetical protein [Candidatus Brocadiales bacterium]